MIKFNNKENILIDKEYPRLYKFISGILQKNKELLPAGIEVKIYDYEDEFYPGNSTGLSHKEDKEGNFYGWLLEINLAQLIKLYKEVSYFYNQGRIYPGKVKGIRNYITLAIYHELGHYNLKHHFNQRQFLNSRKEEEINCDIYAFNKLTQGQAIFEFTGINRKPEDYSCD
jgi:hypothetical protein